jgi:predicted alpha/beta-fold hydrolase
MVENNPTIVFGQLRPPWLLRPAGVQTMLASAGLRAWGDNPMVLAAQETILTTREGVRLLGYHSRQPRPHNNGLVILLHGWEGSSESTYIRTTGRYLFSRGFDVLRLNFRDHGPSHHLNTGLFYAVLLDEVVDAVSQICAAQYPAPTFLAGFSLGGNFALRIARQCAAQPIAGLSQVVGISPVLDPDKATDRIDNSPLILKYFLKKWRRSLSIKQTLYPEQYDFSGLLTIDNIREMTERLLARYSPFDGAQAYFRKYTLLNGYLRNIPIPTTIITAADDPIIPVEDFYGLHTSETTRLIIQPYGGHNGFLESWRLNGWYERAMADMFTTAND